MSLCYNQWTNITSLMVQLMDHISTLDSPPELSKQNII